MVFESIVADLLNKILGEYIQNLDSTQLKLSLWGGKHYESFEHFKASYMCDTVFGYKVLLLD